MSVGDKDEDLHSWGWTDLSGYWSPASDSDDEPGSMSRRSQRLDNSLLDCRLPLGSASLNMGGNAWRNASRMLKSHRPLQQSASCSESLLSSTPRKSSNQSLHGDITDASLLSSLLDKSSFHEASMQESTGADNFWARTDHGGNMSAKQRELHPNGSLCRSSNLGGVLKWISKLGDGPMLTRLPLALLFVFVIPFSLCWFALDSLPALSISDSPTPTPALSQEQVVESTRLAHLERSLALLWERVEAGDQRAEQRHGEMIRMHTQLRHNDQSGKMWLSRLVERQMAQLRRQMNDHKQQREQELIWLQSQMSRLDLVEVNLQKLEAQEEVGRLEVMLRDIRRDVDALLGCQQLDQETISAQVQQGVRTVLFGNEWSESGFPDLRASLASLERSVLHNVSHHLDQRRREEALTREDVNLMVKNALRLFSHDRTGLADYALESGGGSILSTRCSETYETKAALLSLFGVPLWYFSQSPRVVIQPNVHPGNCWAFRGSAGFLVIRLSMSILPTAFSLEHIPKALAPSGTLRSAPRNFQVYGLDDASQERGTLLGSYTYQEDGEAVQTYHVTEENDRAFQIIEVQVLSNWGHQEYTCMYRFRVHGTPRDT
ncbi:uncharacterized protein ACBT44_002924 isoform 8-T10 [Syngnathus typhle]